MPYNALAQTLSFHKSPEFFISSSIADLARTDPSQLPSTSSSFQIIRASILNRNVHVISAHNMCHQVLSESTTKPDNGTSSESSQSECPFQATPAYKDLMAPFFPPLNLLLADGPDHVSWKERWRTQLQHLPEALPDLLSPIISSSIDSDFRHDTEVDVYDAMKTLAWRLLLAVFLPKAPSQGVSEYEDLKAEVEELQETLLRGQFSTFPVSIRTPFWSSARSRGINARVKLQTILKEHFIELQQGSESTRGINDPFLASKEITDPQDIASHVLLFTSGLANKALASILTSSVMNVFLYRPSDSSASSSTLASLLRSMPSSSLERTKMLRSILLETERLSPPVVGVLRRAMEDVRLRSGDGEGEEYTLPKGHEAWIYFPSASRSTSVFGEDAEVFRWDRFMPSALDHSSDSEGRTVGIGFAFGTGPKLCLGQDVSRKMIELVLNSMLESDIQTTPVSGHEPDPGVQAMLGWLPIEEAGGVEAIARDLKQLPTQRPRRPVIVKVTTSP